MQQRDYNSVINYEARPQAKTVIPTTIYRPHPQESNTSYTAEDLSTSQESEKTSTRQVLLETPWFQEKLFGLDKRSHLNGKAFNFSTKLLRAWDSLAGGL